MRSRTKLVSSGIVKTYFPLYLTVMTQLLFHIQMQGSVSQIVYFRPSFTFIKRLPVLDKKQKLRLLFLMRHAQDEYHEQPCKVLCTRDKHKARYLCSKEKVEKCVWNSLFLEIKGSFDSFLI